MSYIHETAVVEAGAVIGEKASVWHHCHVRKGAVIGAMVNLGKGVYVDCFVKIGHGSRVQNGVSIYQGVELGDWCFVGPHVVFTNDMYPRAGSKKWEIVTTSIQSGASIGAGVIVRCGVTLGSFSMIGAGSTVTKSVPAFHLAMGQTAQIKGLICACGRKQFDLNEAQFLGVYDCCRENLNSEVVSLAQQSFLETKKNNSILD